MAQSRSGSVIAVVPTHNRRDALGVCLRALLGQDRPPDAVMVVDNGSTDGTADMVAAEFPEVQYVRLEHPCGSAGGFGEGIRLACDAGCEWVWLMDNDAVPAGDALRALLDAAQRVDGKVFNSLVVTPGGDRINWGYHRYAGDRFGDGTTVFETVSELAATGQAAVNGLAQFYTGALIHRVVVDAVGLPTLGFFTRGDEVDYVLRIQEAGFRTWTVVASRAGHPEEERLSARMLGRRFTFPVIPPWKQYYVLRNELINSRRYALARESMPTLFLKRFLLNCGASLAFPDARFRRLLYTCWGFLDAVLNRVYVNRFLS